VLTAAVEARYSIGSAGGEVVLVRVAQVKPDGVRFIGQVIADVGGREPSSSRLPYRYSRVRAWHQVG
jgi:hypothetical protein